MPSVEYTGIVTSDTAVKSSSGSVLWVLASAAGTGGAWQLNDSTDDGGTDLVSGVSPASSCTFIRFGDVGGGAVKFATGIYADIPGTNVTLTIGYV